MDSIRRILLLSLMTLVVAGLLPSPSFSETLSQKKEELNKLQKEIKEKKKLEKQSKKTEHSILNEFESLDKKWTLEKKELRKYENNIKVIDQDIQKLTLEMESEEKRVAAAKAILDARIRRIYKEGKFGDLLVLAGGKNYQDFMARIHAMIEISKRDQLALREYQQGVLSLKEKESHLEEKRRELTGNKKGASERMEAIQYEKMNKMLLLSRVRTEKEMTEQAIKELEESTLKVQELMRQLGQHSSSRSGFIAEKGRLPWPNKGEVVGSFGRNKHPKFDFFVFKKGLEIRPAEETYIRSIYDGTVVYSDWFKGYGLLIIIDHGESYYSLYAHASKIMVDTGDKIKQDQIIGEIGETGFSADQSLYFEIRHGGKAVDPALWLSKAK
jgi:septal ring factor EnvC (AmiA/AmiB activator)